MAGIEVGEASLECSELPIGPEEEQVPGLRTCCSRWLREMYDRDGAALDAFGDRTVERIEELSPVRLRIRLLDTNLFTLSRAAQTMGLRDPATRVANRKRVGMPTTHVGRFDGFERPVPVEVGAEDRVSHRWVATRRRGRVGRSPGKNREGERKQDEGDPHTS